MDLFIVEERERQPRVHREWYVYKKRGDHDFLFGIVTWLFALFPVLIIIIIPVALRVCL
jgi:hypothetical protein